MSRALIAFLALAASAAAQVPSKPLDPVPFTAVRLNDVFWAPRIETNRTKTVPYCLKICEETGRTTNFAKAAGLMPGKFEGIYFNDSDLYKVIEGASYTLQTRPDPELEKKLDAIIAWIAAAQRPDGYLNTYYTLVEPDKRWTELPVKHELYCAGHLLEAAVAHFQATGKRSLLDVATKFADHIAARFGPDKEHGVPGHPELELALVRLWRVTKEARYLDLAKFFIDERGRSCGRKAYGEHCQDHKPLREQDDIVGHAVRAMYLYSGATDVAALTNDAPLREAMERVWRNVVLKKMYLTGGIGSSAHNEGFTTDYDLPNDTAYAETCASIGMALWNYRLFLLGGDGRFMDVCEQVLYNGLLSGVAMDGEHFFYVNPLASNGHHHRQPWFDCACCPTNIVRFLPSLPGYVYAVRPDEGIWVNLYAAGGANILFEPAGEVKLAQETRYPWDGKVAIRVTPARMAEFTLALRIPAWSFGCHGQSVKINGEEADLKGVENGYLKIRRTWKPGDAIEMNIPLDVRRIEAHPAVKDDRGRLALMRGPLVYCLEDSDHPGVSVRDLVLPREAKLEPERRDDLLGGVTILKGSTFLPGDDGWEGALYRDAHGIGRAVPVIAVPYHAWDHRAPGGMVVWIPESPAATEAKPLSVAGRAKPSASHCYSGDTVDALNDGKEPASSGDHGLPRFTWWDRKGTTEWVEYTFDRPREASKVEVYWFADGAGCAPPASWRLLYKDGDTWKPVEDGSGFGTAVDQFNAVKFKPAKTTGLRIEAKLREGVSSGILEWKVE